MLFFFFLLYLEIFHFRRHSEQQLSWRSKNGIWFMWHKTQLTQRHLKKTENESPFCSLWLLNTLPLKSRKSALLSHCIIPNFFQPTTFHSANCNSTRGLYSTFLSWKDIPYSYSNTHAGEIDMVTSKSNLYYGSVYPSCLIKIFPNFIRRIEIVWFEYICTYYFNSFGLKYKKKNVTLWAW